MGIDLIWRDMDGRQLDEVGDEGSLFANVINRVHNDRQSRELLIARIDPYGDTMFSTGQASQMLRELEAVRATLQDPDERMAVGRVMTILRAAEGIRDQWLYFIGD